MSSVDYGSIATAVIVGTFLGELVKDLYKWLKSQFISQKEAKDVQKT